MKKLMYFAAALLVLVGCKKDNALNNAPEGTPFKKGQQVTLTIGAGNNANQVAPRKVAGIDNTETNQIEFKWEEDDQILVRVDQETAVFTLISEPGSDYGLFSGAMPADGSTFDIQYPINEPNITKQVYTEEKPIPADSMLFRATNCTLDNEATLFAQHAMVQFNLYGTDKTIGMIIFKNMTADDAEPDTLICTGGKTIGTTATEATPFYMVVLAGNYQFEVEVYDNAATPAMICSFATSAKKDLIAGDCLNMPAKEVADPYNGHAYVDLGLPSGLKWATMNVGATTPEGYGDYFAWGETETKTDYSISTYTYTENPTTLPLDHDAANVNWGGNWRMPTKAEFEELLNNCDKLWTTEGGVSGYKFTSKTNSDNYIFLPAAGYRSSSSLEFAGAYGLYWSSSLKENPLSNARDLYFSSTGVDLNFIDRYYGHSVRPVCPAN